MLAVYPYMHVRRMPCDLTILSDQTFKQAFSQKYAHELEAFEVIPPTLQGFGTREEAMVRYLLKEMLLGLGLGLGLRVGLGLGLGVRVKVRGRVRVRAKGRVRVRTIF